LLSAGNVTPSFVKQFGQLFPNDTYVPLMLYYARNDITSSATRSAINDMKYAATTQGVQADQLFISAWDPALLVVDALKKLGASASGVQLHDSMIALKGWVGANGPYDFHAVPQRGIGQGAVVVVRWNPGRTEFDPVSKLGGAPASR
jgi:branched-chain amino acid transport system substrate-binding protein